MTTNAYLVYWSSEGLESVTAIGHYEQIDMDNTLRILNNEDPVRNPVNTIIQTMILRARFNSHRHYELYAVTAADGITSAEIENMFDVNPNEAAKIIRSLGVKLYSDRILKKKVVIE